MDNNSGSLNSLSFRPCPSCGYCPTCGRARQYGYYQYPYYQSPWYTNPVCGTDNISVSTGNIQ